MNKKPRPSILLVDDDEQLLKSLMIWLKGEGFDPVTALSPKEALQAVEKNDIGLALIDLRMGKGDGLMISRQLKLLHKDIKIIILTGFPTYETAVEAMKIGASDYLSKSSTNETIIKSIRRVLEEDNELALPRGKSIPEKDKVKLILFCGHSLIRERLENITHNDTRFCLVKAFPYLDTLKLRGFCQEVDIALLCASCNLKKFSDAPQLFSGLFRCLPNIIPVFINENFTDEQRVKLVRMGIKGFSPRETSSERLKKGLIQVKKGGFLISPKVTILSLQALIDFSPLSSLENKILEGLTGREIEILQVMTLGLKNREIAERLFISEKTVKTHVNRIFRKLGVNTRSKAILLMKENKLA